jgi:cytochrome c551/c552
MKTKMNILIASLLSATALVAADKPDPKLVAQGRLLFQTKICFTCHQADPAIITPAGLALKAPKFIGDFWGKKRKVQLDANPDTPVFEPSGKFVDVLLDDKYFLESVEKPMLKVLKDSIPGMAPLPTTLKERKALLAYVKSLSKKPKK